MKFINNYSQPIELAAGATSAALALPDGQYVLTLAHEARTEIVFATVVNGAAELTRGQEGTDDQPWTEGSVVFCGITAGTLTSLFARLAHLELPLPRGQQVTFSTVEDYEEYEEGVSTGAVFAPEQSGAALSLPIFGEEGELVWYASSVFSPNPGLGWAAVASMDLAFSAPGLDLTASVEHITCSVQIAGMPPVILGGCYSYDDAGSPYLGFQFETPAEDIEGAYMTPGVITLYVDIVGEPIPEPIPEPAT